MVQTPDVKFPKGVTDEEIRAILTGEKGPTRLRNYRLSEEAQRIIAEEAKFYGVKEAKALELLLREHRETTQKKRKKA